MILARYLSFFKCQLIKSKSVRENVPIISSTGGWIGDSNHFFDKAIGDYILEMASFLSLKKVNDLGSGSKIHYSRYLNNSGLDVIAIDFNPKILENEDVEVRVFDLTTPYNLRKADITICLEVGEHIPKKHENQFVKNVISSSSDWLILSWGIIGQIGHGHVNCKSNFEVIDLFRKNGYFLNFEKTADIRNIAQLPWFKHSLFVFYRIN